VLLPKRVAQVEEPDALVLTEQPRSQ